MKLFLGNDRFEFPIPEGMPTPPSNLELSFEELKKLRYLASYSITVPEALIGDDDSSAEYKNMQRFLEDLAKMFRTCSDYKLQTRDTEAFR